MLIWQTRRVLVAILAGCLAVAIWWHFHSQPAPVSVPVIAAPSKAVAHVGTEIIQTPLKVYKPESKKRLNLPKSLQDDTSKHVAASSTIKPDYHPHTVSTVIDDKTGEVTTYDTREPLPWFAVSSSRHYGAYIGALDGQQAIAVTARQEALHIKGVTVEGIAIGAMSQSERMGFVGIGISW